MSSPLYVVEHSTMTGLCDAVRALTNVSSSFTPSQLISQISHFELPVINPLQYCLDGAITEFTDENSYVIGELAFASCSNLLTASFPKAAYVGNRAFLDCSSLTTIYLPKCQGVDECAFLRCSQLTELNLPECVGVASSAFHGCSQLTSIYLPNCKQIGQAAFQNCTSLSIVSVPVCERIFANAFGFCPKLRELYLDRVSSVTILGGNLYYVISSVYVPSSLYSDFLVASRWSDIASKLVSV
jgi:hypothetical protein